MNREWKHPDFTNPHFRGILSEIAREDGVSRQAVHQRTQKRNVETLARIAEKIEQRRRSRKRATRR